jgi:hypothetical protein
MAACITLETADKILRARLFLIMEEREAEALPGYREARWSHDLLSPGISDHLPYLFHAEANLNS